MMNKITARTIVREKNSKGYAKSYKLNQKVKNNGVFNMGIALFSLIIAVKLLLEIK